MYRKVFATIRELGETAGAALMSAISLLDADADLAPTAASKVWSSPRHRPIRLMKTVADGRFIDDALIYRAA